MGDWTIQPRVSDSVEARGCPVGETGAPLPVAAITSAITAADTANASPARHAYDICDAPMSVGASLTAASCCDRSRSRMRARDASIWLAAGDPNRPRC